MAAYGPVAKGIEKARSNLGIPADSRGPTSTSQPERSFNLAVITAIRPWMTTFRWETWSFKPPSALSSAVTFSAVSFYEA